jgi:predicted GNAT superfamily acetyltransferase
MPDWTIRLLKKPEEMTSVEDLQRVIWPGSETDVIPSHMLLAAAHNGGLVLGAFIADQLVGAVFGFPGIYDTPDGPRLKHHSHILGIRPEWSGQGIGFALKRAQWQLVRNQGIDRITWTYDPLLSRNAYLNINRLGGVCNTYLRSEYGKMRDGLNTGLPSDRFQVDWWVNTRRVERHLSRRNRTAIKFEDYLSSGANLLSARKGPDGLLFPAPAPYSLSGSFILFQIPSKFQDLRISEPALALEWRMESRVFFEAAFNQDYLVTDFITGLEAGSYVLTHGLATLDADSEISQ